MVSNEGANTKPEIDFPDFDPPADLVVTDLSEGDGTEAAAGNTVSVHYVGVAPVSYTHLTLPTNREV